jgi:hypothetical protein
MPVYASLRHIAMILTLGHLAIHCKLWHSCGDEYEVADPSLYEHCSVVFSYRAERFSAEEGSPLPSPSHRKPSSRDPRGNSRAPWRSP